MNPVRFFRGQAVPERRLSVSEMAKSISVIDVTIRAAIGDTPARMSRIVLTIAMAGLITPYMSSFVPIMVFVIAVGVFVIVSAPVMVPVSMAGVLGIGMKLKAGLVAMMPMMASLGCVWHGKAKS
ncbi:MAG: hypothetical protein ACE5DY_00290 [Mariprofundaceae bacterium]